MIPIRRRIAFGVIAILKYVQMNSCLVKPVNSSYKGFLIALPGRRKTHLKQAAFVFACETVLSTISVGVYIPELPRVAAPSQRRNLVLQPQAHLAFHRRIPTWLNLFVLSAWSWPPVRTLQQS